MARPLVEVVINGEKLNAVLDTGAWNSYVRKKFAKEFISLPVTPFKTKLGGKVLKIKERFAINGIIKDSQDRGYRFAEMLFPVEDLGKENGKPIDVLFGAVMLEGWGTVIDESTVPPKIDYTRLRKGTLVELYFGEG